MVVFHHCPDVPQAVTRVHDQGTNKEVDGQGKALKSLEEKLRVAY